MKRPPRTKASMIDNRFRLIAKIGAGNCGDVYVAEDTTNNGQEIAIKLAKGHELEKESRRYRLFLNDYQQRHGCAPRGFPELIGAYDHLLYHCIAYQLLGPTLKNLFDFCEGKFTPYTTFFVGEQILDRLRSLHETGYTHGSIKPENITMGLRKRGRTVYLIDFGSIFPAHIPRAHSSSSLWKSINRHNKMNHTRRDDLESWLYVMAFFLHGSLLWDTPGADILHLKVTKAPMWMEELQLGPLWRYVQSLLPEAIPDYKHLKRLLRSQSNRIRPQPLDFLMTSTRLRALQKVSKLIKFPSVTQQLLTNDVIQKTQQTNESH
jgi:casein kinase 1 epsilon